MESTLITIVFLIYIRRSNSVTNVSSSSIYITLTQSKLKEHGVCTDTRITTTMQSPLTLSLIKVFSTVTEATGKTNQISPTLSSVIVTVAC